jgi:beta-lactamase superfamily II metal-dependent hydrolase
MGLLIDMIDVGQGDSFLFNIDGPNGEAFVLIDAGLPEAGGKVLAYVLNKYARTGLDWVVATHIDNDHVGGLATVLKHASFKRNAQLILSVPPAIKNRWNPARDTLVNISGLWGCPSRQSNVALRR